MNRIDNYNLLIVYLITLGVLLGSSQNSIAIMFGQVDDFQDNTTQGWGSGGGNPNPPLQVPDGGPLGLRTGDGYLQIEANSNTSGPGTRLTAIAGSQWTGDYLDEGVTAISADVNNFSGTAFELRLLFGDGNSAEGSPGNSVWSANSISVPAASGWRSILFPIESTDLTGPGDPTSILGDVLEMRLFHNINSGFPGQQGAGILGIDNITAVSSAVIPEPSTVGFFLIVLTSIYGFSRRKTFKI